MHPAWGPFLDEGASTRPDLWPSPGVVITNPDAYLGSARLPEGESFLPNAASKQIPPNHPLKILHFRLFRHLTPQRAKFRMVKTLKPSGALPKTVALNLEATR